MFDNVKDTVIQQFLMKRTGLLSPDATVRLVASNVLVCMSWAGLLDLLLPHMVKILNYKPVEMIDRME